MTDTTTTSVESEWDVPPGWMRVTGVAVPRAFPVSRIVDVEGTIRGGTTIHLDGGRKVEVEAPVDAVFAAVDRAYERAREAFA